MLNFNTLSQRVLHVFAHTLQNTDVWELVESASRVLTDGPNYHFYSQTAMPRELVSTVDSHSHSSGEGSGSDEYVEHVEAEPPEEEGVLRGLGPSDDVSRFYRSNVKFFVQMYS